GPEDDRGVEADAGARRLSDRGARGGLPAAAVRGRAVLRALHHRADREPERDRADQEKDRARRAHAGRVARSMVTALWEVMFARPLAPRLNQKSSRAT